MRSEYIVFLAYHLSANYLLCPKSFHDNGICFVNIELNKTEFSVKTITNLKHSFLLPCRSNCKVATTKPDVRTLFIEKEVNLKIRIIQFPSCS